MKSDLREQITKKLHDSGCSFVEVRQTATAADIALEEAAKIADSEPWPEGPAHAEVLEASKGLRYEQIVEAAVKATRESIALKIRGLI